MVKMFLPVFVLLAAQLTFGAGVLQPTIRVSCDPLAAGATTEFVFGYINPTTTWQFLPPYGRDNQKFHVLFESADTTRILRYEEVWGHKLNENFTDFAIGTVDSFFSYKRSGTPSNPAKPFRVTFYLDGNVFTLDNCNAVQPTLSEVINNCDGSYTAHFGYTNGTGVTQTLPSPRNNPQNSWNYFTARSGMHVSSGANDLTIFSPGVHADCFEVKFYGAEITWHLAGHSLTAKAVSAVSGC